MPRYDKYDPYNGGFRAKLAADWPVADAVASRAFAVGLNASGRIVKGAGVTGIKGILILHQNANIRNAAGTQVAHFKAGKSVDVMTDGEVVDWLTSADAAGVAGFNYWGVTGTGLIVAGTSTGGATAPATSVPIGFTVEATRLVVRMPGFVAASA